MFQSHYRFFFFFICAMIIANILCPTIVDFLMLQEDVCVFIIGNIDALTGQIYALGCSLTVLLVATLLIGVLLGFFLNLVCTTLFFICAFFTLCIMNFFLFTGICYQTGMLFQNIVTGFTFIIFLEIIFFFINQGGVAAERWPITPFWKFKGIIGYLLIWCTIKWRLGLLMDIQYLLTLAVFFVSIAFIIFLRDSFTIENMLKCSKEPQSPLIFHWKEWFVLLPFFIGVISYFFFELPLDLLISTSGVTVLPLVLYFVLSTNTYIFNIYTTILLYMNKKFSFFYILSFTTILLVPFFILDFSFKLPAALVFMERFLRLMLTYNSATIAILKDVMCCEAAPARDTWKVAFRISMLLIAANKGFPTFKHWSNQAHDRMVRQNETTFALDINLQQHKLGVLTAKQCSDNSDAIIKKHINTSGEETTTIKVRGFKKKSKVVYQ